MTVIHATALEPGDDRCAAPPSGNAQRAWWTHRLADDAYPRVIPTYTPCITIVRPSVHVGATAVVQ